ncbi:unnamed protein product [Acanthoscelides obtectus]|uniref:Neprilysin n=1 Tax=Acanthoscelides obtectus TaxID=200917 RepID=A0A9P0KKT5_ACAOB|nr:unnamed protein product [Acanthoscelides obtectus]CAK1656902.1 Neprilysin-2 [Acanthoscelides obtectus]
MSLKGYLNRKITTKLEKRLIFTVCLLSLVVLVLFVVTLTKGSDICETPGCIQSTLQLLETIDTTKNPCEDFYNYTCGTFLKNSIITGRDQALHDQMKLTDQQLKNIVLGDYDESNLTKTVVWQRKFYRSCINKTKINQENEKAVLNILEEVIGGWPLIKSYWVADQFEWHKAVVNAREAGVFYEFFLKVQPYSFDDRTVLWIYPPRYPPDVQYVDYFMWEKENLKPMEEIANYMNPNSVTIASEFAQTFEFARALNETIYRHYYSDNKTDRMYMSIKDIKHPYIRLDWLNFLKNITRLPLTGNEIVAFDVYDYLKDFYYVLLRTQKRYIANYIGWGLVLKYIHYLPDKFRATYLEMKKVVKVEDFDRKNICYIHATKIFQYIAETEYLRRYTTPKKIKYVKEMLSDIKQELRNTILQTEWIEPNSKRVTFEFIKNMTEAIGWTEDVLDTKKFDKTMHYDKVKFTSDNAIEMRRIIEKNKLDSSFERLYRNISNEEERMREPKVVVNAYFAIETLYLPTPLLQGIIFDEDRPAYINYGALGSIIGHEYTHGIVSYLRNNGETYFTKNETLDRFHNDSICIMQDYNNFEYLRDEFSKNGTQTFEENVADYLGVILAYRAYQNWVSRHGSEKLLPSINLTQNQMFWVAASSYMCHEPRMSKEHVNPSISVHGAPSFRVMGRLMSSKDFARDYGCALGSKMNPKEKCILYA